MSPKWHYTFHIGELFHNDALTFEERRDAIMRRMRQQPWFAQFDSDECITEDLETATDPDEWDEWWDQFYDWADRKRVWVNTFSKAKA